MSGPDLGALLLESSAVLAFTGAGISTGSGIPDFRGPQGVWTTRTPVFYEDFVRDEAARVHYWQQKLEDREEWGSARPNATHDALVHLEQAGKIAAVVTQNVDGLHAAAGTSAEALIELHGTVRSVECLSCGERTDPAPHFTAFAASGEAPVCHCGGLLKPATISFGQALRRRDLERASTAAAACDLVLSLGSTLSVTPAADIPLLGARRGVPYVIVNQGETAHDGLPWVTLRLEGDVGEIVPPAVAAALA